MEENKDIIERAELLDFILLLENVKTKGDVVDILNDFKKKFIEQGRKEAINEITKLKRYNIYSCINDCNYEDIPSATYEEEEDEEGQYIKVEHIKKLQEKKQ